MGKDIGLAVAHEYDQLGNPRPQLIGHQSPLLAWCLDTVLGEGGADPRRRQRGAALPSGTEYLGDGCLQSLMCVRDDQLDAAQAASGQIAQKLGPERLGLVVTGCHAELFAPAQAPLEGVKQNQPPLSLCHEAQHATASPVGFAV